MENTKHQWNQDAGLSILESRKGGGGNKVTGALIGLQRGGEQRHIQVFAFKEFKRKMVIRANHPPYCTH